MDTADNIRSGALGLNASLRAALAHDLLVSLDEGQADEDADITWTAEIEARSAAYAAGEIPASDWRESVARCRATMEQNQTK